MSDTWPYQKIWAVHVHAHIRLYMPVPGHTGAWLYQDTYGLAYKDMFVLGHYMACACPWVHVHTRSYMACTHIYMLILCHVACTIAHRYMAKLDSIWHVPKCTCQYQDMSLPTCNWRYQAIYALYPQVHAHTRPYMACTHMLNHIACTYRQVTFHTRAYIACTYRYLAILGHTQPVPHAQIINICICNLSTNTI